MKLFVAAISLAVLAGCATKPEQKASSSGAASAPSSSSAPSASSASVATPKSADANARDLARKRISSVEPAVYFDFNRFDIKPQFHNTVSAYGNYLAVMKESKILVEGNADERGTVEYNLALGQKRAEAVSIALQAIGANANNIEAISNGEEKPRNKAKSEAAFAENRRADLIVR
ncbi:MAG: OmpA family protein [Proteobacteria bacterium]|jgi:peptidoglycan-associated lipoprotein|nr:OmpA family protein [Pseudomonadota bacterium]MDA0876955.1 OmpA family protein [Pseudomonadota bacterium]MDA1186308.1 OmpA family protein [Pseudomonadota bacterium]